MSVLSSCGWWKKIPTTACCFFCGTPAKAENRSLIIYVVGGRKHQPRRVVFLRTPAGAENISFLLSKKKHSLGIMQFQSKTSITNIQSVQAGAQKIQAKFEELKRTLPQDEQHEWTIKQRIINDYNSGEKYLYQVNSIEEILAILKFNDPSFSL